MRIRFVTLASTILAGSLTASVPVAPAFAQEAQADAGSDVLIMRRKITEPNTKPRGPDGQRVATGLGDVGPGINAYRANGEIKLAVSTLGCLKNETIVPEANCTGSKGGAEIGNVFPFPARMDPDLKAVHVTREAFAGSLPYAPPASIDALCESRIGIGSESWRLSCDPSSIVNQYQKYITRLGDPASYSSRFPQSLNASVEGNFVNLVVTDYGCRSTITGTDMSRSTCSSIKREPNLYDVVSLPAELVPQLRKAYVTRDSLKAQLPYAKASQIDAICTLPVRIQNQDWKIACGTAQAPESYLRTVYSLQDPVRAPTSLGTAMRTRNKLGSTSFDWMTSSTTCVDTDTGAIVAASNCQYLASGANIYDMISVGAQQVPEFREIYFDAQDLADLAPYLYTIEFTQKTSFCNAGVQLSLFDEKGAGHTYTAKCGEPDKPADFQRVAQNLRDPAYMSYTGANTARNDAARQDFDFVVQSTLCWDSTKNITVANAKCQYLPTGTSIYDIATIPATYVPNLREVYFSLNDLNSLNPRGGRFGYNQYNTVTSTDLCTGGYPVMVRENGKSVEYTVRCGAPEDPARYERVGLTWRDPIYVNYPGANTRRNESGRNGFDLVAQSTRCWDLTGNAVVSDLKCKYLPQGVSVYDVATLPATYVSDLREVYINQADAAALIPRGGNFGYAQYNQTSLSQLCSTPQSFGVVENGKDTQYLLSCGTPDNPANYERVGLNYRDPAYSSYTGSNPQRNDTSRTEFDFIVYSIRCWDLSANKSAPDRKCSYLPSGALPNDVVPVKADYVPELREVYFDRDELAALISRGGLFFYTQYNSMNLNDLCNGANGFSVREQGVGRTYTARCGAPDNPANYERFGWYFGDPYTVYTTGSDRTRNKTTRSEVDFALHRTNCWDKSKNAMASVTAKCSYLAEGPSQYDIRTLPATWEVPTREVFVKRSDLESLLAHGGGYYINYSNYSVASLCTANQTIAVQEGATTRSYRLRCTN